VPSDPQLQPLRFCSRCTGELETRELHGYLRPVCGTCGFVVYISPKVSCAVVLERDGRVLLVKRRNEPGRGLWCLPCGFAEADEAPETAAAREALEETGLHVAIGQLLGAYHYTDDPRGAGIMLAYRAVSADGDLIAADDADDARFFAPDALPPLSHHTHRRALQDYFA